MLPQTHLPAIIKTSIKKKQLSIPIVSVSTDNSQACRLLFLQGLARIICTINKQTSNYYSFFCKQIP
jgi:hypothetical protein